VLEAGAMIKEGLLRQNALHEIDAFCEPAKQVRLLALFVELYDLGSEAIEAGVPLLRVREALDRGTLTRLKETVPNDEVARIDELWERTVRAVSALRREVEAERGEAPA
jgi:V/A-type H+-transporting ATPase subunit A